MEHRTDRADEPIIEIMEPGDQRRGLVERFRTRQDVQQRTVAVPRRPDVEPGEERALGGLIRRKSAEHKRHEQEMNRAYFAGIELDYKRRWALALEVQGVNDSIQAVQLEETLLQGLPPQSVTAVIGEELVFESIGRIKEINNDASDDFRKHVFRKQ